MKQHPQREGEHETRMRVRDAGCKLMLQFTVLLLIKSHNLLLVLTNSLLGGRVARSAK